MRKIYYLSFDLGTKNFAWCESNDEEIIETKVIQLIDNDKKVKGKIALDIDTVYSAISRVFKRFRFSDIKRIFIEKQVNRNKDCRLIEAVMISILNEKKKYKNYEYEIIRVSPTLKLKHHIKRGEVKNHDIKKDAIKFCNYRYGLCELTEHESDAILQMEGYYLEYFIKEQKKKRKSVSSLLIPNWINLEYDF